MFDNLGFQLFKMNKNNIATDIGLSKDYLRIQGRTGPFLL